MLIVQQIEGLSDRDIADAVRERLALKYLLSLELDDPGFHYSAKEAGLIKARGKTRTDATHILAAARTMERIKNVAETLRAALRILNQAIFSRSP